jgi:membrane-associated phospholipid phosphatase
MAVVEHRNPAVAVLPSPVVVARSRQASAVAWAGLAGFAASFALVRARLSDAFDLAVTIKLQRGRAPWLERLMRLALWPGFPPQSRLIPASIALGLVAARLRFEALGFLAAWGTAAIATLAKALMDRPRPVAGRDLRVVAAPLGGSSFPSGHVITYVGVYGFTAYLVYSLVPSAPLRRAGVAGLVGLICLVGPSRVHQGHHWFTDVVASYLLGISYLIGVASIYRRIKAGSSGLRP